MPPYIHSIAWASEGVATLIVRNDTHSCVVFAHPFDGSVDDRIREPLIGFNAQGIVAVEGTVPQLLQVGGGFVHEVIGCVVDRLRPLIRVGSILIEPDIPLPGDVAEGILVWFRVQRLDHMG